MEKTPKTLWNGATVILEKDTIVKGLCISLCSYNGMWVIWHVDYVLEECNNANYYDGNNEGFQLALTNFNRRGVESNYRLISSHSNY